MHNATEMGLNYTGAKMSPLDSEQQLKAAREVPPDIAGDEQKIALVRSSHIDDADSIGSVPLPGSAKGMLKTALNKLVGVSPEVLIDKLGERLAFERTGTRLYEALIAKARAMECDREILNTLERFHNEEMEHFKLLVEALEKLGADPSAMTPSADVMGVTSMGLLQVISDPRTNWAQSLNALLTAELSDNAGWEMLIELARISGQNSIADSFQHPFAQEQIHLATVKQWLNDEITRQV